MAPTSDVAVQPAPGISRGGFLARLGATIVGLTAADILATQKAAWANIYCCTPIQLLRKLRLYLSESRQRRVLLVLFRPQQLQHLPVLRQNLRRPQLHMRVLYLPLRLLTGAGGGGLFSGVGA
jgi:hypothetical protein